MRILNLIVEILLFWALPVLASGAQDLAAFKIPDSGRPFVFTLKLPSPDRASDHSTNAEPRGVEGLQTILAKGFKTTRQPRGILITFVDAVICRAQRSKGENAAGSVMVVDGMPVLYPAGASVLVLGRTMSLADLNEKTFDPPTTFSDVYEGEAAIKKLKEMGLEPPEDMDWKKATNK